MDGWEAEVKFLCSLSLSALGAASDPIDQIGSFFGGLELLRPYWFPPLRPVFPKFRKVWGFFGCSLVSVGG